MSGASVAVKGLQHLRPTPPGPRAGIGRIALSMFAGALVAVGVWYLLPAKNDEPAHPVKITDTPTTPSNTTEVTPLAAVEIAEAHELPESLHIGHAPDDRHAKAMAPAQQRDREGGIDRMNSRTVGLKGLRNGSDSTEATSNLRPPHAPRGSRQLLFLHDLKLVDPQELYGNDPRMRLTEQSVAARYSDRSAQDSVRLEVITVAYTGFFDKALDRFVHNDDKACLDDLRFLLDQYPDDVNALFYAGLCSYNLGLYERARVFLHRAATHPVDVFDEEAQWYHALTLERLGEKQAAEEAFARIVANGGFYADRAGEHARRSRP